MASFSLQIRRILNIRDHEDRLVALVIGIMFFTSAGFTLGSTGVETLFYTRFGVQHLPGMYMLLGLSSFITSLGITAMLARLRRELFYLYILLGVTALAVIAWALLFSDKSFIYPVLWLGKEIINGLMGLVVWGLAGAVCDTRQSKRLFPLFNAGRILGTVLGGLATGVLVSFLGTGNLLLVWAGFVMVAFFITRLLLGSHGISKPVAHISRNKHQPSLVREMQQGFNYTRSSSLMRWISLSSILFSILYFSIALPFSQGAAAHFPSENTLAGFLGLFNGLTTAAAFLVSFFAANRIFMRFGIMNAILALPLIYLAGFGGMVFSQVFIIILVFRFAQMTWLSGITDSAYQAMFNAVPERRREQARAFVNGVPAQAGTFIAGAILIVGQEAFSARELALLGVFAAALTIYTIWRIRGAYTHSLVESLQQGRPTFFATTDDRHRPEPDAAVIQVTLAGLHNPDPHVRRVSSQILAQFGLPAAIPTLVDSLRDEDVEVRSAVLQALALPEASSTQLEVAACLADPSPIVRAAAIDTLRVITPYPLALQELLTPLLNDPAAIVRVRASVSLLKLGVTGFASTLLRQMAMLGSLEERVMALQSLAEVGDQHASALFEMELADLHAPAPVRCAAAKGLGCCGIAALPALRMALASDNALVRAGVASALAQIGETALPVVMEALGEPQMEAGALTALEGLPAWNEAKQVLAYAQARVASSLHYDELSKAISSEEGECVALLSESLAARAGRDGIFALRALGALADREIITVALENLQDPDQRSNALEALESIREADLIRPLFQIWDPGQSGKPTVDYQTAISQVLLEPDQWLQWCARYVVGNIQKDETMDNLTTLTIMDRVLLLRGVPLLKDLTPLELQRVAAISSDLEFLDGEMLCQQGEPGDQMFVIVSGEVRVVVKQNLQSENEVARRNAGEVVGEMSIISGEPRIASVIADGEVHALCLDRINFESLLRERPEISLAVMRVLCKRISQLMLPQAA